MPTSRSIIESLLFVAEGPLSVEQLQRVLPETDKKEIKAALAAIKDDFDSRQGGFFLQEVAGGYQFRTPAGHKEWIREMFHPGGIRLSRAALETLAIIAYRQPVMRSEIEHIRGVNSGGTIRLLLERKLIRILGRREIPGRPLVYGTTRKFLEAFALKDIKDLPEPKEIDTAQNPSTPGERPLPLDSGAESDPEAKNNS